MTYQCGLPAAFRQPVQCRGPRAVGRGLGVREPAALAPRGRLFPHLAQHRVIPVHSAARRGLYPGLPSDWTIQEAPEYFCEPTLSAFAYVPVHWLPPGRAESAETEHTRGLVRSILLSEWAVLALLCFPRAAHEGLRFFTKCSDPWLLAKRGESVGERGMLFRLSAGPSSVRSESQGSSMAQLST